MHSGGYSPFDQHPKKMRVQVRPFLFGGIMIIAVASQCEILAELDDEGSLLLTVSNNDLIEDSGSSTIRISSRNIPVFLEELQSLTTKPTKRGFEG